MSRIKQGIAATTMAALFYLISPSAIADTGPSRAQFEAMNKPDTHQSVVAKKPDTHQSVSAKKKDQHESVQAKPVPPKPEPTLEDTLTPGSKWDTLPNGQCVIKTQYGTEEDYIPLELLPAYRSLRDGLRALDSLEYTKAIICKNNDGTLSKDQSAVILSLKNHPVVKNKYVTKKGKRTKARQDNKQAKDQYKYHFIAEELNVAQAALGNAGLRIKVDAAKDFAANYANLATVNVSPDRLVALVEKEDGLSANKGTRELYVAEDVMLSDGTLPPEYTFADFAVKPKNGRFVDEDGDPIRHLDNETYRIDGQTLRRLMVRQREADEYFNRLDPSLRGSVHPNNHVYVPLSFLEGLDVASQQPEGPNPEEGWKPQCKPCPEYEACPPAPGCPEPAPQPAPVNPAPVTPEPQPDPEPEPSLAQCVDGVDNDNDGATDYPYDKDCESPYDNSEAGEEVPPKPEDDKPEEPKPEDDKPYTGRDVPIGYEEVSEEKDSAKDDMYVGLRGNYERNVGGKDFVPGKNLVGGSVSIGGYVGEEKKVGIGIRAKGLYAGKSVEADPRNRETQPNPNDPDGLGSVVEGHTAKRAQVWTFGPEFRFDFGKYAAFIVHGGAGFIKEEQVDTRREALTYPNGDVMNESQDRQEGTNYRAVGTAGVGLEVCPVKSKGDTIDKKVCFDVGAESTFNGDGASVGGYGGLIFRIDF